MTREQLQREADFDVAMAITDSMLKRRLIDRKDYEFLKKLVLKKYAPIVAGTPENPASLR